CVLDVVREGRIHLTGLRLLAPHVTAENLDAVLASAAGKSKRAIEELVATLAPKPPVPPSIRKLPERAPASADELPSVPLARTDAPSDASFALEKAPAPVHSPATRRPEVKPLSAEAWKVEFTANRALKEKLQQAEELMGHSIE